MQRVVFCDFDGTITIEETFVATLKRFTPDLATQLLPEISAKRVTLREGVRRLLESIPSERYPDMIESIQQQPIHSGLPEFLDFLEDQKIPFVIISGGLRDMVESVVQPFLPQIAAIHAVEVETRDEYLQPHSAWESDTELVAKARIMTKYQADEAIAIGDSITDLNLALAAPIVFARPPLSRYLDEHHKPYHLWNDFTDVQRQLAARLQASDRSFKQSLRSHQ
ncbi:HAD-IB family phosphatase [Myxacorys almedinensis]|uniref:HAD-IB family phosphatase n=1 Tax=Myxacorys almedinensis A TaxID=2690445 RepID=A0A8J7Z1A6_9CYAN|nr:HAD-IB family phosphatase [Myxacorys almedinensis]NDJ18492.1 HAD-IB family phosphatase [Myxacorys almedinensis A]